MTSSTPYICTLYRHNQNTIVILFLNIYLKYLCNMYIWDCGTHTLRHWDIRYLQPGMRVSQCQTHPRHTKCSHSIRKHHKPCSLVQPEPTTARTRRPGYQQSRFFHTGYGAIRCRTAPDSVWKNLETAKASQYNVLYTAARTPRRRDTRIVRF